MWFAWISTYTMQQGQILKIFSERDDLSTLDCYKSKEEGS